MPYVCFIERFYRLLYIYIYREAKILLISSSNQKKNKKFIETFMMKKVF